MEPYRVEINESLGYKRLDFMSQIQYHGDYCTTKSCIEAIVRILQFNDVIDLAVLITFQNSHAFLLTVNEYQKIIIQPGFTSGYDGEGPIGLARVIRLLQHRSVELDEVSVSKKIFLKIQGCKLDDKDLMMIEETPYIRPRTLGDYVYNIGEFTDDEIQKVFPTTLSWAIIDSRILDLALCLDQGDSSAVLSGFNRLETILKDRCPSNVKTLKDAAAFIFTGVNRSDSSSAAEKFVTAVYTLFRNIRAHEESNFSRSEDIRCFMLLNELYLIEKQHKYENN